MSEERPSQVEIHEDFLQHVEDGSSRIRLLAVISSVVALILIVSYVYEIALSFTGTTRVTVTLNDPTLVALEIALLALAIAWLYVGVSNYRFTTSLAKRIAAARAAEVEMEKKLAT